MKKISVSIFAIAIACATSFGQTKPTTPATPPPANTPQTPNAPPPPKHATVTPEQRSEGAVTRMDKELTLTEAQKPKVKEIMIAREKARDAAREKYKDDRVAMAKEMRKCNEEAETKMDAILTKEQKDKQKALHEERIAKAKERQAVKKAEEGKKGNDTKKGEAPPAPNAPAPPPAPKK